MALVIRLRQQGKTNRRSFRLVVTDKRSPRDGKYVENLGWYDPCMAGDKNYLIKEERIQHWLDNGAEISPKAESLVARAAPEIIKKWKEKFILKVERLNKKKRESKSKK